MKLLFIPGSGCAEGLWVYQTEYFTDSEAVALPGHPEGKPCSSIDDYMEWLRGHIHQNHYQDVVLSGHSMGSAVALLYELKHPEELKALVLIGCGARLRVHPAIQAMLKEMITNHAAQREWLENEFSLIAPQVKQALLKEIIHIDPTVMLNDFLCCDKFDVMDKVHTIKLPTLVICGSQDNLTPVKYAHYLTDKIEGATELIIEGGSHWMHLEKPKEVNQAIETFLGNLD